MTRQISEKSLIQKAIERDSDAFTQLYWRNVDRVYKHVYYKIRNQSAAEDITQETFIKAWKSISKYKDRGHTFAAWLITIANNNIYDHFKANRNTLPLDETNLENINDDLLKNMQTHENHNDVHEAISMLAEEKQKVVIMRYIEGFSFSEIARMLKKSEGAVRVTLHRSLHELRKILRL
jgi:RNA polymerase sigma-70 factor, ECF subfamily